MNDPSVMLTYLKLAVDDDCRVVRLKYAVPVLRVIEIYSHRVLG